METTRRVVVAFAEEYIGARVRVRVRERARMMRYGSAFGEDGG